MWTKHDQRKDGMNKDKFKKVIDWMWDYFDFRYCFAYWTMPPRHLKKSDLTVEDAENFEEYYDCWLIQEFPE